MGRFKNNMQEIHSATVNEINLAADFGESQGVGRVLAQPTLRTQPGVESKFLSGGEFPVKNSNALQSQTTWKSYGLKIALTPSLDAKAGDSEVSVDFHLEFSEPNMEHAVEGIPSLLQRQLDSRFDVRVNELAILTTMVSLREGKSREGIAFLSQIPIIGLLFGSDSRLKDDSELWFALKPTWDEIPLEKAPKKEISYEAY
jgi:pilus assembly protein CpaC